MIRKYCANVRKVWSDAIKITHFINDTYPFIETSDFVVTHKALTLRKTNHFINA